MRGCSGRRRSAQAGFERVAAPLSASGPEVRAACILRPAPSRAAAGCGYQRTPSGANGPYGPTDQWTRRTRRSRPDRQNRRAAGEQPVERPANDLLNSLKTGQNRRDVGKRSAEQPANDWPNRQTKRQKQTRDPSCDGSLVCSVRLSTAIS